MTKIDEQILSQWLSGWEIDARRCSSCDESGIVEGGGSHDADGYWERGETTCRMCDGLGRLSAQGVADKARTGIVPRLIAAVRERDAEIEELEAAHRRQHGRGNDYMRLAIDGDGRAIEMRDQLRLADEMVNDFRAEISNLQSVDAKRANRIDLLEAELANLVTFSAEQERALDAYRKARGNNTTQGD